MAAQIASNPPVKVDDAATGGVSPATADELINSDNATSAPEDFAASVFAKYTQEREKRLRPQGQAQFINLSESDKFNHLAKDRWADTDHSPRLTLNDGIHTKVFIVGGGFGGLLYAVRLVQAGIKPDDVIIADSAGGYGGTWYWNRYPGLMCDVESYIYLPLLEETGYVPKHKYSYGSEIRQYANQIAEHWHLENRGAFQQTVNRLDWDETNNHWQVSTQDMLANKTIKLTSDFVVVAPGLLSKPKINEFAGMDIFKGQLFHTSRWDYDYTGGSPTDPSLTKLHDKKVGIIGTGATAIQAIPHLAAHAKELYVFQRTPSSVDRRDQRPTDPSQFATQVSTQPGWQRERNKNFNSFLNNVTPSPETNLVNDGWSNFRAYSALLGGPKNVTLEDLPSHISSLHELDLPRSEKIRARVNEIVSDPTTAESLKAWYPGWCKRPCFHDDYLSTFNLPNVHLVDTAGAGVSRLTAGGVVANDTEFALDCIVLSTGYNLEGSASTNKRANIATYGRNQRDLEDKWSSDQVGTLHGLLTHDFPNLFFSGPAQATASANFSACLDVLAQHAAYIVSTALQKSGSDAKKVVIEPTLEAEEAWSMRILGQAITLAGVSGCTPGYLNGEGDADRMDPEKRMKSARIAMWGRGMEDYMRVIEEWRDEGKLEGLTVTAV